MREKSYVEDIDRSIYDFKDDEKDAYKVKAGLTPEIAANSIYEYIENTLGMQIITSKRRITVEHATARDEKLLDMGTYGCVAVVVNQTFNAAGLLFEYTQSRHQPDYFCFQDIATRKK